MCSQEQAGAATGYGVVDEDWRSWGQEDEMYAGLQWLGSSEERSVLESGGYESLGSETKDQDQTSASRGYESFVQAAALEKHIYSSFGDTDGDGDGDGGGHRENGDNGSTKRPPTPPSADRPAAAVGDRQGERALCEGQESAGEGQPCWDEAFQRALTTVNRISRQSKDCPSADHPRRRALLEQEIDAARELRSVVQRFSDTAGRVARCIVDERGVPAAEKQYPPVDAGGVAGGEKFVVKGIFFKFARDWTGIYGGDDDAAAKSAQHEFKAANALVSLQADGLLKRVTSPLMCLVRYGGFAIVAVAVLPISAATLVYGSADAGVHIHAEHAGCQEDIRRCGERLNLKEHAVRERSSGLLKSVTGPCDMELHEVGDRLYCLDTARLFPACGVRTNNKCGHLTELLRMEFCLRYVSPLSSDAFSGFGVEDMRVHNGEVHRATGHLLTVVVPQTAAFLDAWAADHAARLHEAADGGGDDDYGDDTSFFNDQRLSRVLHVFGVNVRMLWLVHQLCREDAAKTLCMRNLIARAIKREVRRSMRIHDTIAAGPLLAASTVLTDFFSDATWRDAWRTRLPALLRQKILTDVSVQVAGQEEGAWPTLETVLNRCCEEGGLGERHRGAILRAVLEQSGLELAAKDSVKVGAGKRHVAVALIERLSTDQAESTALLRAVPVVDAPYVSDFVLAHALVELALLVQYVDAPRAATLFDEARVVYESATRLCAGATSALHNYAVSLGQCGQLAAESGHVRRGMRLLQAAQEACELALRRSFRQGYAESTAALDTSLSSRADDRLFSPATTANLLGHANVQLAKVLSTRPQWTLAHTAPRWQSIVDKMLERGQRTFSFAKEGLNNERMAYYKLCTLESHTGLGLYHRARLSPTAGTPTATRCAMLREAIQHFDRALQPAVAALDALKQSPAASEETDRDKFIMTQEQARDIESTVCVNKGNAYAALVAANPADEEAFREADEHIANTAARFPSAPTINNYGLFLLQAAQLAAGQTTTPTGVEIPHFLHGCAETLFHRAIIQFDRVLRTHPTFYESSSSAAAAFHALAKMYAASDTELCKSYLRRSAQLRACTLASHAEFVAVLGAQVQSNVHGLCSTLMSLSSTLLAAYDPETSINMALQTVSCIADRTVETTCLQRLVDYVCDHWNGDATALANAHPPTEDTVAVRIRLLQTIPVYDPPSPGEGDASSTTDIASAAMDASSGVLAEPDATLSAWHDALQVLLREQTDIVRASTPDPWLHDLEVLRWVGEVYVRTYLFLPDTGALQHAVMSTLESRAIEEAATAGILAFSERTGQAAEILVQSACLAFVRCAVTAAWSVEFAHRGVGHPENASAVERMQTLCATVRGRVDAMLQPSTLQNASSMNDDENQRIRTDDLFALLTAFLTPELVDLLPEGALARKAVLQETLRGLRQLSAIPRVQYALLNSVDNWLFCTAHNYTGDHGAAGDGDGDGDADGYRRTVNPALLVALTEGDVTARGQELSEELVWLLRNIVSSSAHAMSVLATRPVGSMRLVRALQLLCFASKKVTHECRTHAAAALYHVFSMPALVAHLSRGQPSVLNELLDLAAVYRVPPAADAALIDSSDRDSGDAGGGGRLDWPVAAELVPGEWINILGMGISQLASHAEGRQALFGMGPARPLLLLLTLFDSPHEDMKSALATCIVHTAAAAVEEAGTDIARRLITSLCRCAGTRSIPVRGAACHALAWAVGQEGARALMVDDAMLPALLDALASAVRPGSGLDSDWRACASGLNVLLQCATQDGVVGVFREHNGICSAMQEIVAAGQESIHEAVFQRAAMLHEVLQAVETGDNDDDEEEDEEAEEEEDGEDEEVEEAAAV